MHGALCIVHCAACTVTSVVYSQHANCIRLCCVQLQYTKNVMVCHICMQNLKHYWSCKKSGTFSTFFKISEGPKLPHQGPNLPGTDLPGPNLSQRQKVCDPICRQISGTILLGPNLPNRGGGQGWWSSRTFDLLFYFIIDLKRSIDLR